MTSFLDNPLTQKPFFHFSVKPFGQSPFGLGSGGDKAIITSTAAAMGGLTGSPSLTPGQGGQSTSPSWQGRSIATHKLRLLEFSAYVEQQRDAESYHKHLFVHIGGPVTYSDPVLEPIDVRQIQDKFPEKKGGLKELYEKGPQDAFYLVKFWADLNTNISDEAGSFYGVTTT